MTPPANTERDKTHRFPGDISSHGVGRYARLHLRDRDGKRACATAAAMCPMTPSVKGVGRSGKTRPSRDGICCQHWRTATRGGIAASVGPT